MIIDNDIIIDAITLKNELIATVAFGVLSLISDIILEELLFV